MLLLTGVLDVIRFFAIVKTVLVLLVLLLGQVEEQLFKELLVFLSKRLGLDFVGIYVVSDRRIFKHYFQIMWKVAVMLLIESYSCRLFSGKLLI